MRRRSDLLAAIHIAAREHPLAEARLDRPAYQDDAAVGIGG